MSPIFCVYLFQGDVSIRSWLLLIHVNNVLLDMNVCGQVTRRRPAENKFRLLMLSYIAYRCILLDLDLGLFNILRILSELLFWMRRLDHL